MRAPAAASAIRYSRTVRCLTRCWRASEAVERAGSCRSDAVTPASFLTSPSAHGRPGLLMRTPDGLPLVQVVVLVVLV
jgi:hypothetical protein